MRPRAPNLRALTDGQLALVWASVNWAFPSKRPATGYDKDDVYSEVYRRALLIDCGVEA
jgi:hypothetical protein